MEGNLLEARSLSDLCPKTVPSLSRQAIASGNNVFMFGHHQRRQP